MHEGEYEIQVSHSDFISQTHKVLITPGKQTELHVKLSKVTTHGQLIASTTPPGGTIFLADSAVGINRVDLGAQPFGTYRMRAEKIIDATTRTVGSKVFRLIKPGRNQLTIKLDQQECLFDGEWLAEKNALAREAKRYQTQKIAKPLVRMLRLNDRQADTLRQQQGLADLLHGMLRVGDRLTLQTSTDKWLLWKRHQSVTAEFHKAVAQFTQAQTYVSPWSPATEGGRVLTITSPEAAEIAYQLHQSRTRFPLLNLTHAQLNSKGERVLRSTLDSDITLVAHGGQGIAVADATPAIDFSNLQVFHFWSGDKTIVIKWQAVPERLLIVADAQAPVSASVDQALTLRKRETRLLPLIENLRVPFLTRMSHGPDYQDWNIENFQAGGPLAAQMNYARDEVGPNQAPGSYQRIWIARFPSGKGTTQRQINLDYQVIDEMQDFESDRFLRRDRLSRGEADSSD